MCVCVYTGHTFLEGALFSTAERCIVHVFHLLFLTFFHSYMFHMNMNIPQNKARYYHHRYTPITQYNLPSIHTTLHQRQISQNNLQKGYN